MAITEEEVIGSTAGERVLAAAAARLGDPALERVFGHRAALGAVFAEMARAFVPRVANGFAGDIQYDLRRADGRVRRWTVRVAGTSATAHAGPSAAPAVVVRVGLADFLRVAAGQLSPLDLLRARRLLADGDGLLAARLDAMFGRPAPRDIYVAPPTVDAPGA